MNVEIDTQDIKEIPYGISDYGEFRNQSYYYVDKTSYLKAIHKAGKYLFFIRPRRFGKSLFLTMMSAYFDVYYKDQFEELFKDTWIYHLRAGICRDVARNVSTNGGRVVVGLMGVVGFMRRMGFMKKSFIPINLINPILPINPTMTMNPVGVYLGN